jgi:hypothetical protein
MESVSMLTELFHSFLDLEHPPIIELLDINQKPVGALYLDKMKYKNLLISETTNSEKYLFYCEGIGIYFSFYKKLSSS